VPAKFAIFLFKVFFPALSKIGSKASFIATLLKSEIAFVFA